MSHHMWLHVDFLRKIPPTFWTFEWLYPFVHNICVFLQCFRTIKGLFTLQTWKGLFTCVNHIVWLEVNCLCEGLFTFCALEIPYSFMSLFMPLQAYVCFEWFFTLGTMIRSDRSVCMKMQFETSLVSKCLFAELTVEQMFSFCMWWSMPFHIFRICKMLSTLLTCKIAFCMYS